MVECTVNGFRYGDFSESASATRWRHLGGVRIHFFFFFQAEDGIRYLTVTGVQTCALPISSMTCPCLMDTLRYARIDLGITITIDVDSLARQSNGLSLQHVAFGSIDYGGGEEIGRASCRERG